MQPPWPKQELSTQQATDLLGVSRPYLITLLDNRKIPHRKVGKHHRISLRDLLRLQRQDQAQKRAIMAELTATWQGMDPY